jgi:hypothetical protein
MTGSAARPKQKRAWDPGLCPEEFAAGPQSGSVEQPDLGSFDHHGSRGVDAPEAQYYFLTIHTQGAAKPELAPIDEWLSHRDIAEPEGQSVASCAVQRSPKSTSPRQPSRN